MRTIDNKFKFLAIPLVLIALMGLSRSARAQIPMELRGFVDTLNYSVDSIFAYNKKNGLFLASSGVPESDTSSVSNRYKLQINNGANLGDTLYFRALSETGDTLDVNSINGSVIHEPGQIKRVDLAVVPPTSVEENYYPILPNSFLLSQNYPNPFNSATTIKYDLPRKSDVELSIYDINGRKVKNLVSGVRGAGEYSVNFSLDDAASGIYFARIKAGNETSSRKIILVK